MLVKSAFNKSLRIEVVVLSSPNTRFGGCAPLILACIVLHLSIKLLRSDSKSAVDLCSATVLMMTPKFLGLIRSIKSFNRSFSSKSLIFWLTEILSEKGTNTRYLPAKVISEHNRGPLVEIGSLATCTKIG